MDVEALFRAYREPLFRFLTRLSGDPDLAEDTLQETFIRFIEQTPARIDNVRAWLFTVGANRIRDHARVDRRRQELLTADPAPDSERLDPLRLAELREQRERIQQALGQLSGRERTAVLMREEGFTHREIADAIGTTTGTIGTLLARAFARLAGRLELDGER